VRLRRRRPLYRWSPQQIAEQVEACYVIGRGLNTDQPTIRATLVFDQNPKLLPRRTVRRATEAGDFKRYLVFKFFAGVHAIVAARSGGVEEVRGHDSLTDAIDDARHQLPEGREVQFHELPRVTRSAFLLEVCGRMPTTEEWLAAEFGDRRR
jgi:hypothetical protein